MKKQTVVIRVQQVSKAFKLPHEKQTSLKSLIVNFGRKKSGYERQHVLQDISFDIGQGEFVGIVGRNGSGKSTLLKLLAGIYTPDEGVIDVRGKLTPFIELGVGFNPELTGRENVFLNGALLGFNRQEMSALYDRIVDFAELENFMDQKLKNYSSGMQVRLAFSIAIRANSEILLLDEVLAVGDAAFQQKCYAYFDELKRQKRTIILVSHDMNAIKQFCDRAILVSKGKLVQQGDPAVIAAEYERLNFADTDGSAQDMTATDEVSVTTSAVSGGQKSNFEYGDEIVCTARWPKKMKVENCGFVVYKNEEVVFATNSFHLKKIGPRTAAVKLQANIGDGRYKIRVGLFGPGGRHHFIGMYGDAVVTVYNQPKHGPKKDEWEGVTYFENTWL